jgi:hypothetical protein
MEGCAGLYGRLCRSLSGSVDHAFSDIVSRILSTIEAEA